MLAQASPARHCACGCRRSPAASQESLLPMRDLDVMILAARADRGIYNTSLQRLARLRLVLASDSLPRILAAIRTQRPHLLLLDTAHPGADGIALLNAIVSCGAPTGCIVCTQDDTMQAAAGMIARGAFDYIIKPCEPVRLASSLERYLRFHDAMQTPLPVEQKRLDDLYTLRSRTRPAPRADKGVSDMTLERVKDVFLSFSRQHTADSVADSLGVCKTTARRYLEYCVSSRFLRAELDYGRIGRPVRVYRRD